MVGGGTGHSILYLAEQLRETDAEVKLVGFVGLHLTGHFRLYISTLVVRL